MPQPNRDMHPEDRANLLKVGMAKGDIDAYERGDVDWDFQMIADEAKGK